MTESLHFEASAAFIRQQFPQPIQVVAILGSGLGKLADRLLVNSLKIPYETIPDFPRSTVEGHQGALCLGTLKNGLTMACLQGRFHYYEGHPMSRIIYPLRVMRMLGAETLVVTNAAGGVNPNFKPGSLMLINDHINLMGTNPLIGENMPELGPRFPDMSAAYTPELRQLCLETAQKLNIPLQQGVYCAMTGPSYETPAEIRMIRTLGGDAVGMSTAPEVIAASHMGMRVLGISCITNPAAGVMPNHRLSHQEVLDAAEHAKAHFSQLVEATLMALPATTPTTA